MLVISRMIGESFFIGDDMEVVVVDITGGKVVLGVQAPKSVPVTRLPAPEKTASSPAPGKKNRSKPDQKGGKNDKADKPKK